MDTARRFHDDARTHDTRTPDTHTHMRVYIKGFDGGVRPVQMQGIQEPYGAALERLHRA